MEAILSVSDEIKFLLVNTDGLEILCPKNKEKDVVQASLDFMTRLGFAIDVKKYKNLIIKNVNEYIGEYDDSSVEKEHLKLKGCFEIDKEIQKDVSARIIPIALKEYFINGIPVSTTIKNHKNIFDFCIRLKINKYSRAVFTNLNGDYFNRINLGRTTRYFCSNSGGSISVFYNNSETPNRINKDYSFTLFNKYYDSDDYDINYQYYISEANKIKNAIEDMQLNLF